MGGGVLIALFILSLFLFGCSNGSTEPKKPENSNPIETPQTPNDEQSSDTEQNTEDQTPQDADEDKNNDDENIDDDEEDTDGNQPDVLEVLAESYEIVEEDDGITYINLKGHENIWLDDWEAFKAVRPNGRIKLNFITDDNKIDFGSYLIRAKHFREATGDNDIVVMYLPNDLDEVSQIKFFGVVTETELSEVLAAIKKAITKDENGEATVHTEKLPTFSGVIIPSISENLYENIGGDVYKLLDLYYNSDVFTTKYRATLDGFVFDAKEALNGGSMYKDSNEQEANTFNGAYNLDINKALLMHAPLKNVNVTGKVSEKIKTMRANRDIPMNLPYLTNVHFDADLNDIEFVDKSFGIVEFAGLPPHTTPNIAGKVIIHKTGEYDVGIRDLNVLQLGAGVNTLERITPPCGGFAQNIAVGEVYYDGSQVGSIGLGPDAVYHRDSSEDKWGEPVYLKNGYTPKGKNDHYWEQRGNGEVQ